MDPISPTAETETSQDSVSSPPKSGRLGKTKTRTGCVTCKIRRVKCDESKPSCKRCTSTGRKCDGYLQPGSRKPKATRQPIRLRIKFTSPIPTFALTSHHGLCPKDLRSLSYFHSTTASLLGPWISNSFWKYHLPQLSSYSRAPLHAIIALSACHEGLDMLKDMFATNPSALYLELDKQNNFSVKHYMSSVSALARAGEEEVLALATCAVFVILSFMLGNFAMAILHMHGGVAIAERVKEKRGGMNELERLVVKLFENMTVKGRWENGDPITSFEVEVLELRTFNDLREAGESMERLTSDGMRLIRVGVVLQHTGQEGGQRWMDLQDQIYIHETNISCWSWNFEPLISTIEVTSPEVSETIDELWIAHLSTKIWLHISLTADQPEPKELFKTYVEGVEQIHKKWAERGVADEYAVLKSGMSPLICYVARNADDPELRIRATKLLVRTAPGIVGIQTREVCKQTDENILVNEESVIEIEVDPNAESLDLILKPGIGRGAWQMVQQPGQRTISY